MTDVSSALRAASPARFKLQRLNELGDIKPTEWLIDELFPVEAQVLLFGPPGQGKSFLALDWALSIASGRAWHDREVRRGPVIYVAGEGKRGILKRTAAWRQHYNVRHDELSNFFIIEEAPQLLDPQDCALVSAAIKARDVKPSLVVFDTLARSFGAGDENATKDMMQLVNAAARLQREQGTAVMLVHHTGKNSQKLAEPRGNSSLPGAADTIIRVGKKGDQVTVTCTKQKDDEEFDDVKLRLQQVDWATDSTSGTSCILLDGGITSGVRHGEMDIVEQRMLDVLRQLPNATAKVADWRAAAKDPITGREVPQRTFDRHRERLQEAGLIVDVRKGVYQVVGAQADPPPAIHLPYPASGSKPH